MRRFFIILLTVMALLLTACGTSEQGTNPPEEKKAYTYPGEERQMAYRNPAFENAATAEGAAYSPSFTDPALQNRFSYTGIIHWVDSHNNHV